MEIYSGVAFTDGVTRNNQCIPFKTLLNTYEKSLNCGTPCNIGHDNTKLFGWNYFRGIYIEPGKAYCVTDVHVPENESDRSKINRQMFAYRNQLYVDNHKDEIAKLRKLLGTKLSAKATIALVNGVAFHDKDILFRVFPQFKPDDSKNTKALTDLKDLPDSSKYIPGIFRIGDYIIYAHTYFRRNCSIKNSLNVDFLMRLQELRDNKELSVKIKLDSDLVGLARTETAEMEAQYWWGPKYNDDLTKIPKGVTRHKNENYNNGYSDVDFTEFGWYEQDDNKTFECEEVEVRRPNIFTCNENYYGCRYVHSFLSSKTGLPVHLDGAIRAYTEEQVLNRMDTVLDKAGRNTYYTKLWRIDGDIPVARWKELITHYFRDNILVGEFFGATDKYLTEREFDKQIDSTEETETHTSNHLRKGDGLRIFYSKWPIPDKDDEQNSIGNADIKVKTSEVINYGGKIRHVIDKEIISVINELLRRKLIIDYSYPLDTCCRIVHGKFVNMFPGFICKDAETVDKVINVIRMLCTSWAHQGDNRLISFSISIDAKKYRRQCAFAGHIQDFNAVLTELSDDLLLNGDFHDWMQAIYDANNRFPIANNHPKYLEFITDSKELLVKDDMMF